MVTLSKFEGNFWKNLQKIVRKLQIIFEKNCGGTPKELGDMWCAVKNLSRSYSKLNTAQDKRAFFIE